jgi:valyl-tRNA synthetase
MSKFKGNIIDPLDLIDKYGSDALRFTLAAQAAQGRDIKFSETRVEGNRNFATKLWNAARYAQMNHCVPDPSFNPAKCRQTVNRWIVGRTISARQQVEGALEAYRFNDAANVLYQFAWGEFCDWYLEFTKPILSGDDAAAQKETRAATAWVLGQLLHLLHPIMPFITEELWGQSGGGDKALIGAPWPAHDGLKIDEAAAAELDWLIRAITSIRAVRSEMNVPPAAQLALQVRDAGDATQARLKTHRGLLMRLARLSAIDIAAGTPAKGAVQVVMDEATFMLPLAGVIDVAREQSRLQKEIEKIGSEVSKLSSKLGNEAFVAKAPPEVIEEQRERLTEATAAKTKLAAALERLAAL